MEPSQLNFTVRLGNHDIRVAYRTGPGKWMPKEIHLEAKGKDRWSSLSQGAKGGWKYVNENDKETYVSSIDKECADALKDEKYLDHVPQEMADAVGSVAPKREQVVEPGSKSANEKPSGNPAQNASSKPEQKRGSHQVDEPLEFTVRLGNHDIRVAYRTGPGKWMPKEIHLEAKGKDRWSSLSQGAKGGWKYVNENDKETYVSSIDKECADALKDEKYLDHVPQEMADQTKK